jgi:hypothetical protein
MGHCPRVAGHTRYSAPPDSSASFRCPKEPATGAMQ